MELISCFGSFYFCPGFQKRTLNAKVLFLTYIAPLNVAGTVRALKLSRTMFRVILNIFFIL